MRKTMATVAVLCLVWIGYTAWPLYDLFVLIRAMETPDVATVTRHVYFDAVRVSLTNQIVAAYVRGTGIRDSLPASCIMRFERVRRRPDRLRPMPAR